MLLNQTKISNTFQTKITFKKIKIGLKVVKSKNIILFIFSRKFKFAFHEIEKSLSAACLLVNIQNLFFLSSFSVTIQPF